MLPALVQIAAVRALLWLTKRKYIRAIFEQLVILPIVING